MVYQLVCHVVHVYSFFIKYVKSEQERNARIDNVNTLLDESGVRNRNADWELPETFESHVCKPETSIAFQEFEFNAGFDGSRLSLVSVRLVMTVLRCPYSSLETQMKSSSAERL